MQQSVILSKTQPVATNFFTYIVLNNFYYTTFFGGGDYFGLFYLTNIFCHFLSAHLSQRNHLTQLLAYAQVIGEIFFVHSSTVSHESK